MIERLTPPGAVGAEVFDHAGDHRLFPEEAALVTRAVASRQAAFGAGRACARVALAGLGRSPAPIGTGPKGEPLWPAGVVGSLTHCAGYAAAVVADVAHYRSLGVDAEPDLALPTGVLDVVGRPEERARVTELAACRPGTAWDRLLFCAKEAVYKAWYPLTGRWLDFEDVTVALDPDARTFAAALHVPGPVVDGRRTHGFAGRWLGGTGLLVTLVAVPVLTADPPAEPLAEPLAEPGGGTGPAQVPDCLS